MTNIQEHLWHLSVGRRLKGYKMTVLAVNLAIEDEERLLCAQEFLYKPIAEKLNCDFRTVERDIRTVIEHAWLFNPSHLAHLPVSLLLIHLRLVSSWISSFLSLFENEIMLLSDFLLLHCPAFDRAVCLTLFSPPLFSCTPHFLLDFLFAGFHVLCAKP